MSSFNTARPLLAVALLTAGPAVDAAGCNDHAPYSTGTVRISARFDDCGTQDGFGFIVGERRGKLYAVTADHVVRCDHDGLPGTPPQAASRIDVSFCEAPDEPVVPQRVIPAEQGLDVALLKLSSPGFTLAWRAPWCAGFQRADPVWFVGRQRRWYVAA